MQPLKLQNYMQGTKNGINMCWYRTKFDV